MCDELDDIRQQQMQLAERAGWLMKRIETFPTVQPMTVAFRYGVEERNEAITLDSDPDPLLGAYRDLLSGEDAGACSAVGVEVGGTLLKMDELKQRYPDAGAGW